MPYRPNYYDRLNRIKIINRLRAIKEEHALSFSTIAEGMGSQPNTVKKAFSKNMTTYKTAERMHNFVKKVERKFADYNNYNRRKPKNVKKEDKQKLIMALWEIIEERGIPVSWLCTHIGVGEGSVNEWLNMKTIPDDTSYLKLKNFVEKG